MSVYCDICALPVSVIFKGGRFKEIITLSLHYIVSIFKGRRLLVDNHIMCAVDVDVDADGLSRVITDRDTRLIKGMWPTPRERKEFGPKRSVTGALL